MYVTALLPLIIYPIGDSQLLNTLTVYAYRIIFLLLGGFMIAVAIENSMLHKRFALNILNIFGTNQKRIILAFMIVTASISAWMSNTATTMLMLPIALAVIGNVYENKDRFALCLLLSVAYAANIGGSATLIGTPPNMIFASLTNKLLNVNIGFTEWLIVGLPLSIITLIIIWFYMVNIGVRLESKHIIAEKQLIINELKMLGRMSRDEKLVAIVFATTAILWITNYFGKIYCHS